jgi:quinolinate synthase
VLEEADFVGSTAGMIGWIKSERPRQIVMVTECSMSDNVAAEAPETEILRPCNLCPHMKRITVAGIRDSLLHMQHEVRVAPEVAVRARVAVERMLEVPA